MSKNHLTSEIRKAWSIAKLMEIEQSFTGPVALQASEDFKRLATSPDVSYEQLYLEGLQSSQYNIILRDYSFLQFGSGAADEVRYAFYPNPFIGASQAAISELAEMQEYVEDGVMGVDEFLHKASELRVPQHPPLIRYEYSVQQYRKLRHPCSHIHLGFHSENRLPIRRRMSAWAFSLFIFRLFYLRNWVNAKNVKSDDKDSTLDKIYATARQECRILYENEFSEEEELHFHLF